MPADSLYPADLGPEPRPEGQFRADLVRYLDSLPTSELGSLLYELPRTRTDVLMIELNERLPDSGKLLPPGRHAMAGRGPAPLAARVGGRPSRGAQPAPGETARCG